jgi:hypothetical protein
VLPLTVAARTHTGTVVRKIVKNCGHAARKTLNVSNSEKKVRRGVLFVTHSRRSENKPLQEAARARNIELPIHAIAKGEEIATAIDAAQASGATALNVLASPMLHAYSQIIMDRVAALNLPAIYQCPKRPRKAALPPTDRALFKLFESFMPDSSFSSSAASRFVPGTTRTLRNLCFPVADLRSRS